MYAEKDFNLEKHPEIEVPNLQVIKLMQSFKSKEYVTERFAWRHYYWCGRRLPRARRDHRHSSAIAHHSPGRVHKCFVHS